MPLTNAERVARFRAKKKANEAEYAEYKNAQEQKKSRCMKMMQEQKQPKRIQKQILEKRRAATRKRVAKSRALKKEQQKDAEAQHQPFRSASAFGKAMHRAKRAIKSALPCTPRRRKAVCRNLLRAEHGGAPDELEGDTVPAAHGGKKPLPDETADKVLQFYERDDISRQAPGRRDVVNIRNEDGTREKRQARHLTMSIKEAHALFSDEHPDHKIGMSKFAELRPKQVLLANKLPHNVCMCQYHENFIAGVNAMHKACKEFPLYSSELPGKLLCKTATRECWLNKCTDCKDGLGFQQYFELYEVDTTDDVTWYVWKNDENERLCKTIEEGTVEELKDYLIDIAPTFLTHCYIKRQQAAKYAEEREAAMSTSFSTSDALLQVDYSENYTCSYQDEVQSAHWQQRQVSLFTAALWHSGKLHSKVIASDNLKHSKETLVAYVSRLLDDVPKTVKTVSIWSDGPSSQFKNRYVAAAIPALEMKHGVKIHWNYFATSHGKGPVDGIGGSVKRHVWTAVKMRKTIVNNATSFVGASNGPESSVEVFEMSTEDIVKENQALNLEKIFSDAPAINGISMAHLLVNNGGATVFYVLSSDVQTHATADELTVDRTDPAESDDAAVGSDDTAAEVALDIQVKDWCAVWYDGELYPGEVKSKVGDNYEVSTMARAGGYWKFPRQEDKIFYSKDKVEKKLECPVLLNARGIYKFPDFP